MKMTKTRNFLFFNFYNQVCKGTLSPVWHEQFDMKMFVGKDSLPILELGVWDKDSGKDEFMGRYVTCSIFNFLFILKFFYQKI